MQIIASDFFEEFIRTKEGDVEQDDLTEIVFFQAEDGIRDVAVTGVQTCALPIYRWRLQSLSSFGFLVLGQQQIHELVASIIKTLRFTRFVTCKSISRNERKRHCRINKIGRASCRERV